MGTYCVYKHTSPSGKVYIGITKKKAKHRWANGCGYKTSPHFWSAIQKYGWENFKHEILLDGLSKDEACREEQRLITELNATDRNCDYNQKLGGEVGSLLTDEVKDKISAKLKAFYENNPQAKIDASVRATGYKHTDEAKAKMSESKRGRTFVQTLEWRKHIGDANRAKIMSDPKLHEETTKRCVQNGMKCANPVIQFDMQGNELARFDSAHDAERNTGIKNGNIGRCCRGDTKSAGGYIWQYAIKNNSGRETA